MCIFDRSSAFQRCSVVVLSFLLVCLLSTAVALEKKFILGRTKNLNTKLLDGCGALTLTQEHYIIYPKLEINFLEATLMSTVRELVFSFLQTSLHQQFYSLREHVYTEFYVPVVRVSFWTRSCILKLLLTLALLTGTEVSL